MFHEYSKFIVQLGALEEDILRIASIITPGVLFRRFHLTQLEHEAIIHMGGVYSN